MARSRSAGFSTDPARWRCRRRSDAGGTGRDRVRACGRKPGSAITRPIAGPIPKPCPLRPVATNRPGIASVSPSTGTASGVTSIMPAQAPAKPTFPKAGTRNGNCARIRRTAACDGAGSSMRTRSNSVSSSAVQRRAVAQAPGYPRGRCRKQPEIPRRLFSATCGTEVRGERMAAPRNGRSGLSRPYSRRRHAGAGRGPRETHWVRRPAAPARCA